MARTCRHPDLEAKGPGGHGGFDGIKAPPDQWVISCPDCGVISGPASTLGAVVYSAKAKNPALLYVWRGGLKWYWEPEFGQPSVEELLRRDLMSKYGGSKP